MRKFVLLSLTVLFAFTASAQDFSNKGTDFWVGYGYHQVMNSNNGQNMVIYIATEAASVVTIAIPGVGYSQTYNIPANTIFTTPAMPKNGIQDSRLNTIGLLDRGIHVTSDIPIVAYAHIYNASVSGACVLLPTNTLGKEYYSINYTNNSNTADANCWFYVIATEPGTTDVEIIPSQDAIGHPAGIPFTVTLTQGQIYNVMGTVAGNFGTDLTGSVIRSLAGAGVCKRIGVFSGSGRIYINCGTGNNSSDNYMVQAFSKTAWGRTYLTAPTAGSMPRNIYRICVSDRLAVVKINGAVTTLPLINNFYYEIPATSAPQLIESDLPITVAQYITTQGTCGNGTPGDPEVIYLSPVEQNIKDVLFNSNLLVNSPNPPNQPHQHWVHAVIPNGGTALSSFRIDGAPPVQPFIVHPQNPAYSYIQIPLAQGQHRMLSDSGFNAIAYGYASTESYGYNAGTNVIDLSQQMEVESQYGIETSPSVCTDALFRFKAYFPDSTLSTTPTEIRFDSIKWTVSNPAVFVPNNFPVMIYGTVGTPPKVAIDSVNIRNGRQVAWYSIPGQYSVTTPGVYDITITTYRSSSEGCGNEQVYAFQLAVTAPPVPSYTYTPGKCVAEAYQFTETTPQAPKPTYRWYWNFGDPGSGANNISTVRNPTHTFSAPGTYTVKYVANTTPGCLTDTVTQQIIVDPLPSAIIDGTNTVCINGTLQPITFTGSGVTAPGEYTFYYHLNAGGPLSVNSAGGVATIFHNPTVAGTYTYILDSVKTIGSTLCVKTIAGQQATITVTPDATLNLTSAPATSNQTVCINNAITNITYAVGGSGTGGTVTGLPTGVTGTYAGGVITITGIPTVSGTFNYTVNTTGPCVKPTANGTITVNADATINLTSATGTDNQTICINTLLTNITYAVGGGGTGGTVTGLPAGVTGTYAGGVITIFGIPTVAGTFNYTVNTTGPCVQPTASGTITITADATLNLTSAPATANQTVCINIVITNITYAVGGTGTGGSVTGLPAGVTGTYVGGVITITGTPTVAGTFNYTVNTTGPCVKPTANGTITVTADATLNLTSAAGTDNQTRCINTAITNITYSVGGSGTGGTVTGLPAGVTGTYAGGVITIFGTPTLAGTFNYTVNTTGPCVKPTASGTITVTADATLSLTSAPPTANQTVCINNVITNITYSIGGTGTGASITAGALPAGVTGVFAGGVFTISGTPTVSGTFNFTVGTAGPCVNPALSGSIVVNANSTIALSSAAGTDNQTKCINTALTTITYAIGGGGTGASITAGALPAGVTGTYAGGVFMITGTPTVAGVFNYTVGTSGPCINNNMSGTITVTPNATLALTSAAPTANQTVCINNAITNITYAIAGSGTGASITAGALPAGVTGVFAGGVFTISGTPTVSGTFNFTVGTAGPCVNPALSGSIVVNANSTIALSSAAGTDNQAICINNSIVNITYAIGGGGTGATITAGALPAGVTGTYAAGVFTISGTATVAGVFSYTVGTSGPCINNIMSGTITINPAPSASITGGLEVCQNAAFPNILFTGSGGTRPYTFTYTVNGGAPQTVSTTALSNSVPVSQSTVVANTFTYKLLSVQDGSVTACSQLMNVPDQVIKVNPLPSATISGSKLVCINSAQPDITFTGSGGTAPYTFTYQVLPGGPLQTISTIGSNTSVTLQAPTNVAGTFTYRLISVRDGSITACVQNMSVADVVIDVSNVFPNTNFSFTNSVCIPNAVVQFQNLSTIASGSMTYSWNFGDGSPLSAALSPSHQYYFAQPFNVTLIATSNAGCATPRTIQMNNIHPQPKADFSFSNPGGVCIGDAVTLTDLTDGKDGIVNQWNWDMGDATTLNTNPVTYTYTTAKTYTVKLYTMNSMGCNSDTISKSFTVHPYPVVDAGPDRFILEGGQITLAPIVTGNDLQFVWTPNQYLIDNKIEKVKVNKPLTDMLYTLTVTARGGCTASDVMFVKLLKFPKIPNTFTPNGDGINDKWNIDYLNTYPDNRVQVFTRSGQLVFESRGYNTPWDGTIKGKPLPFDTYYYIIEPGNGRDPLTGYVTIIK